MRVEVHGSVHSPYSRRALSGPVRRTLREFIAGVFPLMKMPVRNKQKTTNRWRWHGSSAGVFSGHSKNETWQYQRQMLMNTSVQLHRSKTARTPPRNDSGYGHSPEECSFDQGPLASKLQRR